jgi:hypothetical protein
MTLGRALTATGVALLLAGCGGSSQRETAGSTTAPSPNPAVAGADEGAVAEASSPANTGSSGTFERTATGEILLPQMTGTGSRELGKVVVGGGRFDVVYRCTGTGSIAILNNGLENPTSPCDGIENVARIITDVPEQVVAVVADSGGRWELFVRVTPADGSS